MALESQSPEAVSPMDGPLMPPNARRNSTSSAAAIRKRARATLSCTSCRTRKLKCDRSQPCENCIQRNIQDACSYSFPPSGHRDTRPPARASDRVQDRIDKLERLVLTLVSNNDGQSASTDRSAKSSTASSDGPNSSASPPALFGTELRALDEAHNLTSSFGDLEVSGSKTKYTGDSHWTLILQELAEVKTYLKEHEPEYEQVSLNIKSDRSNLDLQSFGPTFFLGQTKSIELDDLLNRLPNKVEVDKLVERYFDDYDPGLYILHIPSWRRRYKGFWSDPSRADAIFLAQLYAICGLSMQSYAKDPEEPFGYKGRLDSLSAMYRELTKQCLSLVDYNKLDQTAIEAFILHMHAEYQRKKGTDTEMYTLSRMVISLAMSIGMHRDGAQYPGLTPFQCELRRRQWAHLRMVDVIWSFTVGLPNAIKDTDTDTKLPSNLRDEDFDEDSEALPMPRSTMELTDISFLIVKARIAQVFARCITAVSASVRTRYEDIIQLCRGLHDAQEMFPVLKMRPPEESDRNDPAGLFAMRLSLSTQYHKGVCVLHRKFLVASRENPTLRESRRRCVEAALGLLRNQQLADTESAPGGRFYRLQAHTSAYMNHDFILGATLIALDLLCSVRREASGLRSDDIELWGRDRKKELLESLERAREIWAGHKERHVEAAKAYSICGVMLEKIHKIQNETAIQAGTGLRQTIDDPASHETQRSLGLISPPSVGVHDLPGGPTITTIAIQPFTSGADIESVSNMDWDVWDGYIHDIGAGYNFDSSNILPASVIHPNEDESLNWE